MMPVLAAIHGGFGVVLFLAFFLLVVLAAALPSRPRRSRLIRRAQWEKGFVDGEDE